MTNSSNIARTRILDKLKAACENTNRPIARSSRSVRVFPEPDNLLDTFVSELTKVNGEAFLCRNADAMFKRLSELVIERNWNHVLCRDPDLRAGIGDTIDLMPNAQFVDVEVSITRCEALIARSGSVLVSSSGHAGRLLNVFPPVHIVLAEASQLMPFLNEAIAFLKTKYADHWPSQATVITGPSRTADIEKTLVMGAHGPKELLVLIDKNS